MRNSINHASAIFAQGASGILVGRAFRHDKKQRPSGVLTPEGLSFDFSGAFLRGCPIVREVCEGFTLSFEGWAEATSKVTGGLLALRAPVLIENTQAIA
jgi:hypothetical protein